MRKLAIIILAVISMNYLNGEPKNIDVCESSPNCISSLSSTHPAPILTYDPTMDPMEGLLYAIQKEKRFEIKDSTEDYVHAIFHSRIFHFEDDFKAAIVRKNHQILFSSRSRIGYYDFSVNKRRVERIIRSFKIWEAIAKRKISATSQS